jgi:ankyrin repeat protein
LLLFFIFLFTGCGRSSAPARMNLTPMDVPLTEREFIETARQNDPTGAGLVVDTAITQEERDRPGQTPPMIASLANHLEIIRFLLARKAEGNPQDNESGTAPATAAWMGNSFLSLVADGVDPNTIAYAATTSVMFAVWEDHTGKPISDPRDMDGQTALNRAGIQGAKRQ